MLDQILRRKPEALDPDHQGRVLGRTPGQGHLAGSCADDKAKPYFSVAWVSLVLSRFSV